MPRRLANVILTLLLTALPAAAQFYSPGNEPVWVRWRQIKTQDYKVVYPEGLDSLARVYAANLECVKQPVGFTSGYLPNENSRKQLPVILHPWTAYANGMVMWAPKRMELYTTPDFQNPLPEPWENHLTIHESRHLSQLQFSIGKPYRFWNVLLGQMFTGAMSQIYGELAFLEGDAVVAETELTASGRGRNSAFLEYYRAAFREGDFRNWGQWRYGSIRKYVPDHYTLGYITVAGLRSVYDVPDFTSRFYHRVGRNRAWPWPFFNFPKTVKETTGKATAPAFEEICDTLSARWTRDELARAPFMPSNRLSRPARHYTDYSGMCQLDGRVYAIRRGLAQASEIVRLKQDGGRAEVLGPFATSTSRLRADEPLGRIYWSEIVSDARWDLVSYSEVWYMDSNSRRHCLKHRTRWYNPSVSPDGTTLSVTEYPFSGGSAVLVVDANTGEVLERFTAPAGMQAVESEWVGDRLLACAVTSEGQGIYDVRAGYRRLLACHSNVVKELTAMDGTLYFVSDLKGVDELYALDPETGEAQQVTSTRQGAASYLFTPDGLLYSMLSTDGRYVYSTPVDSLPAPQAADFAVPHRYEFADELTAAGPGVVKGCGETDGVPESSRYSRLGNMFRFHSWAPIYVNYDAVSDLSFDSILSDAGLGATAFFQNELNTLDGVVAYNAAYGSEKWTHRVETKFTYSGLYPKIEASLSLDTDPPYWYFLQRSFSNFSKIISLTHEELTGVPSFNASVLMYVPLNLSSGGWYRGIVPQVRWSVSNSLITRGKTSFMNRMSASLRGYVVKGTPSICLYPKLGAGLEVGWSGRPGATGIFTPNAYVYTYGYLPGFMDSHGIRLSGTVQVHTADALFGERYASVLPRGFGDYKSMALETAAYPLQSRVTFDYAFPFWPIDWSGMYPFAYVRNLECKLHGDYSYLGGAQKMEPMHLGGVGTDLCVVLGNLAWIPGDTRIGVQYYYNFGAPAGASPHYWDIVFNVDL